jgi:TetR/AcrR family transcriptional repressor of lmrAB and yxaGH operons
MPIVIVKGENAVPKDSRASMVRSAASLIGSQGVTATSFSEVLADSGAPRGSIYHHFPEGKNQLARDAIRWTSDRVLAYQSAVTPTSATEVLERFISMWRQVVVTSRGGSGCVVAGVAIDTDMSSGDGEGLIAVVRDTFRSWIALLASQLGAVGVAADQARAIAQATVAGMEGALILCRAEGDVEPLETVAAQLMQLLPPDKA